MVADLVENPHIPHTLEQNPESIFWVVLKGTGDVRVLPP